MSLEIINKPILATIQDLGRFSYAKIGVSTSGVMDEYSYMYANKILENPYGTNCIEISFSNVIFKAHNETQLVITGAKCEFFINDIEQNSWQAHNIKTGDIIKIGKILEGSLVYLAVKNGFTIAKEFDSNSTTLKENIGGLNGTKLQKGDILPYVKYLENTTQRLKQDFIPLYENEITINVLLCAQDNYFSKEEKEKFFSTAYTITKDFNRMGCKLKGEKISCELDGIISEGISFGSIQIPSDGQPIILLKERQTIGGYPKIGTVLNIDCFKLSQMKPNSTIRFKEIDILSAQNKVKEFYSFFNNSVVYV